MQHTVANIVHEGAKAIDSETLNSSDMNYVAQQVGGKGGGKPEMAMAGGNDPSKLGEALAGVKDWVASK